MHQAIGANLEDMRCRQIEGRVGEALFRALEGGSIKGFHLVGQVVQRVPEMQEAKMKEKRGLGLEINFVTDDARLLLTVDAEKRGVQRPRAFYRREEDAQPLIVAKP